MKNLMSCFYGPLTDFSSKDEYMVDVDWFDQIHCRRPLYTCINFYEYFILNEDNEIIDSIKLYPENMGDRFVITDKETYDKIKSYMN